MGGKQSGGWVDAIYNNPNAINEYIVGTKTSGIMRTTDGGEHWHSVTDNLDFPVLGIRQFIAVPGDADHIIALTGCHWNEGSVIYSQDGGATWDLVSQPLPEFYWMDFHPTIPGLAFATAETEIYSSTDYGLTWSSLGAPPGYISLHKTFWRIIVLSDRFFVTTDWHYDVGAELFRGDFSVSGNVVSTTWSSELTQTMLPLNEVADFVDFSNKVGSRFYLQIKNLSSVGYTYKTINEGNTFNLLPISLSGSTGIGQLEKNELIASVNDSNTFYWGAVYQMRKYNDLTGSETTIYGDPLNNGYHADNRCSQIFDLNGKDRIPMGNDGGAALIPDGLAANPKIQSLNGNLSINLLHAFDVHEATGRVLYAFQDHAMRYRDSNYDFSSTFLWEGAGALIQKRYPDAFVGEYSTGGIRDHPEFEHPIVNGILGWGRTYLGGYFVSYLHFPERFARGLAHTDFVGGAVAMNRAANVSEISPAISPHDIGPTAICEQRPETIYAASYEIDSPGADSLFLKSEDDGYTWIDLSDSPVTLDAGATVWNLNDAIQWKTIRAIAVDHTDPDLVYCGINGTHKYNGAITDDRFRVIRSTDGGNSFTDYSEGLPALPVERLLTIASDNDLIFCATSVGVYYRNDTMPQWECYSQDLPKVMITGMKFDYCNRILHVSTYGRGMWQSEVGFEIPNSHVTEISENTTWSDSRVYYNDIHIQPGAILTVKKELLLSDRASIIIEPGAKLIVDGGILSSVCGDLWQGIQVRGNSDLIQTEENQGTLVLKNGAVIENARNAVRVWQPGDFCSTGGIVQATDAIFRNNRRSVEFIKYPQSACSDPPVYVPSNNLSFFKNCTFENNDDNLFESGIAPLAMVTLWGVKGVDFFGCDFVTTTSVPTSEERGKAIYSIDADYLVDGYCPGTIPLIPCPNLVKSTFTGFNTAVEAAGAESNPAPVVKNSVFDKNMLGVFFDDADHATALFNEFTVGGHPHGAPIGFPDLADYHTAIKTFKASEYIIEENTVTADPAATDSTHGILIVKGGDESLELYKNAYHNLSSASIAVGDNQDLEGSYGLRFICNQNFNNRHDFEIRKDYDLNFGHIDLFQSGLESDLQAAGNTFSPVDGLNDNYVNIDFYSDDDYIYRYDETAPNQTPNPDEIYVSHGSFTLEDGGTANTCPTHFPSGGVVMEPGDVLTELGKYQNAKMGYYNLTYTYHQFIDKGNTEGILNDIALSWPEDAWALRNELMRRSPYNSDTVLIAAADKNILPHGMLLEVLIANPDALRGGRVIEHVKCCIPDPMPIYMIDILESAKDVRTARTVMEHNMSNLHARMSRAHRKLMLHYLTDSVGTHPDTLIAWQDEMKTREGRYRLAFEHLHFGNYGEARTALDSLENSLRLTNAQKIELAETRQYITFLENIHVDGRSIAELDTAEVIALKTIANKTNGGTAAARADNVLCFFYGICRPSPGYPKSAPGQQRKPKPPLEELLADQNRVTVKPNPADQYIELEYSLLFEREDTYLKVWDAQGRQVEIWHLGRSKKGLKLFDTRHLAAGVYVTEVLQDGKQVFTDKFIVRH